MTKGFQKLLEEIQNLHSPRIGFSHPQVEMGVLSTLKRLLMESIQNHALPFHQKEVQQKQQQDKLCIHARLTSFPRVLSINNLRFSTVHLPPCMALYSS
jgi:hypothetical protein